MSVTAVPLQPVKRSYIWLLWIGIAVAVIAAFLLARQGDDLFTRSQRGWDVKTTSSGLKYEVIKPGTGASPTDTDVALVQYEGRLRNGKVFDKSQQPMPMPVKGVVPGFSEALKLMHKNEKIRVWIPADLAYGAQDQKDQQGNVVLPANSPLMFDIELKDFLPQAVVEQYQRQMQMMNGGAGGMGGPGGPGGAPGGAGGPPPGGGESLVPPPGQ
ncbi:FKBP-type peptidyl-prolyl cis-trans isomerase [Sphingomonas sp.]|uniref:FKBP-type peptidyl-prolyl cis-trans isomerase n=1 Tax=Sphingomonas sp. TaxID=28214 RepID=UPI0025D14F65|nr:FKBP-type peptidyl-prolyl cis-trans isomerase [Sphingomonas sp.]